MKQYLKVKDEVMEILVENAETRDSDCKLYMEYLRRHGVQIGTWNVYCLLRAIDGGAIASMETVGRARREAQRICEDVRPTKTVGERRKKEYNEMTEYFRRQEDGYND